MTEELKPCPFCNETEAEVTQLHELYDGIEYNQGIDWTVRCNFCSSSGEDCSTRIGAIYAWNTRAEDAPDSLIYPPTPDCEQCRGTGWYGDNGPGRQGNREFMRCECTMSAPDLGNKMPPEWDTLSPDAKERVRSMGAEDAPERGSILTRKQY